MTNDASHRSSALAALLFRGRLPLVIAALLLFMAFYDRSFFIPENLLNIVSYSSINGLLAIGMTLLMISREFDISVGSNLVLSGVVGVLAANHCGPARGIALGVASGGVMGLVNGWLVAKAKVNSFIATLGSMVIFQGIAFALTDMKPVACDLASFQTLGGGEWLGLPFPILCFAGVTALLWFLLKFTRVGKNAYAIGGNSRGCRNLGIAVDRWRIGYFVICGVCASLAGVILASKLGAASATFGENVALVVIAAIVLGGVPLTGGAGSVPGVVGAILLLGLIDSMTIYLNVFGYYQKLFWALLLIGVVVFDVLYARRQNRQLEVAELLRLKGESGTGAMKEVGLFFFLLALFCGCHPSGNPGTRSSLILGVCMSTFTSPYASAAVREFKRTTQAQELGLIILDAQSDIQREAFNIDNLIAKRVDAILVNAVDSKGSRASLRKAARRGIPVICFNSTVDRPEELGVRAYSGPQYYEQAVSAARVAIERHPNGKVVMITGDPGYSAANEREKGFTDTLAKDGPGLKMLDIQTANWMRENAQRVMSDFITKYGRDIHIVYSQDDNMTAGAVNALKGAGHTRKNRPFVISIGAMADGLPLVKDGWIDSTIMQSPKEEAQLAIQVALKVLRGEQAEPFKNYFMSTAPVDTNNVDGVIAMHLWD